MARKESNDLTVRMREDLFAAYRDVTSKPCPSQRVAWLRTVKHPAKRYYVDIGRAAHIMNCLARGRTEILDKMSKSKKRMYISLFNLLLELSQKKEFQGKNIKYITSFAITMPAPEFFIGWESFKKTFRNAKRYGIDFWWPEAMEDNKKYTNMKDNKPHDAVFTGKIHHMINK